MECTSCEPGTRKDKPHTFFCHEQTTCPTCETPVEGRMVLRDGSVVCLIRCATCGPRERMVATDERAWVEAFLARGQHEGVFKHTTSTCPGCLALIDAAVTIRGGRVYFVKDCARCGKSEALVSEDAAYYVTAYAFARAGTEPLIFRSDVKHGCPTDCGTCNDHEQHTCLPIVEITDHCNLECPICIVNNQYSTHMSLDAFQRIVNDLVAAEGTCESIALSGGEPTSHPELLEVIRIATRPEIQRVVIITNGLRLGKDREFAAKIKASGAYVALQLDGFTPETHEAIRGRDLCSEKEAALRTLKELQIPTQLIFVATKGINDHQIGQAVELLLANDHILSLNF